MRNRSVLALVSALFVATVTGAASAQLPTLPPIPGLPPFQGPAPQQPAPPPQEQPAPPPQEQPVSPPQVQPAQPPGGLALPQLPPQLQQVLPMTLPGQQPATLPSPYPPAPGYGQPYAPSYGAQPGYGYSPPSYPPYQASPSYSLPVRTGLEIGYLYGAAVAYGVGVGIWIDAEAYAGAKVDPGMSLIAPLLAGAAMPMAVFFADRRPMREGLPSAIASGLVLGAGEGLVLAIYGSAQGTSNTEDTWGFRSLARAEVLGATLGGIGGVAYGWLARPTPKRTLFITSATGWGAVLGYQFGGGASSGAWQEANDATALGGILGYNLAFGAAAVTSVFWSPSWNQLCWMWGGFGIGEAVSALVYPFYAATGGDARRGLVFQGVAGSVGAIAGAFIGRRDQDAPMAREQREDEEYWHHRHVARIRGGGLMPVPGGVGASINGELW